MSPEIKLAGSVGWALPALCSTWGGRAICLLEGFAGVLCEDAEVGYLLV